jgi:hypothetical protein
LLLQRAEEAKQKEKTTPSGNRLHKASDIPMTLLAVTWLPIRSASGLTSQAACPLGKRCAIQLNAVAGVNLNLPVKGDMVTELRDQHMGEKASTGLTARDGQRRHRFLHHRLAFRQE